MWCVGYRVVRRTDPERDGKRVVAQPRREVVELGMRALVEHLNGHAVVNLPGPARDCAGPSGTLIPCGDDVLCDPRVARNPLWGSSPIAWTLFNVWPQLVDYYAARGPHPAKELGARTGPRGRQPAGDVS